MTRRELPQSKAIETPAHSRFERKHGSNRVEVARARRLATQHREEEWDEKVRRAEHLARVMALLERDS